MLHRGGANTAGRSRWVLYFTIAFTATPPYVGGLSMLASNPAILISDYM